MNIDIANLDIWHVIFFLIGLTKGSQSFGANFNWFRMDKNDSHYARLTSSVYPIVNCAPPHVGDPTPTAIEHRSREGSRDDSVARAQWRGDSRKRGAARKPAITIAGPLLAARPLCNHPRLPLTSRRGAFTNGFRYPLPETCSQQKFQAIGITGSNTCAARAAPKWSVTLPPNTSGGRSAGSSCTNGPQPFIGCFMFESVAAGPSHS